MFAYCFSFISVPCNWQTSVMLLLLLLLFCFFPHFLFRHIHIHAILNEVHNWTLDAQHSQINNKIEKEKTKQYNKCFPFVAHLLDEIAKTYSQCTVEQRKHHTAIYFTESFSLVLFAPTLYLFNSGSGLNTLFFFFFFFKYYNSW